MRALLQLFIFVAGVTIAVAQDEYENSWLPQATVASTWTSITTSSTGQYVVAVAGESGTMYQSNNYGVTWVQTTTLPTGVNYNFVGVASDSTGTQIVAVSNQNSNDGAIYLSTDTGASWTQSTYNNAQFTSVCSSSSGQYLFATSTIISGASSGGVFVSSSYGQAWTENFVSYTLDFTSCAVSSDGKYAIVATSNGGIWQSTGYGANGWGLINANELDFQGVSSDSTGQYLAAVVNLGGVYYSLDYGTNWAMASSAPVGQSWYDVTSDSTGQYLAASVGCGTATTACSGFIYLSSDYGQTWYLSAAPSGSWNTVASTSNGGTVYTASYTGVVYTGTIDVPGTDDTVINSNDDGSDDKKLSDGALAGIVIGGVVFVAVAGFAVYYFLFRSKSDLDAGLLPTVNASKQAMG